MKDIDPLDGTYYGSCLDDDCIKHIPICTLCFTSFRCCEHRVIRQLARLEGYRPEEYGSPLCSPCFMKILLNNAS